MKAEEIVTEHNIRPGAKVTRGPDWEWDDQDNHQYGILEKKLYKSSGYKWIGVKWPGKFYSNGYRISGKYDLVYVDESDLMYIDESSDLKSMLDALDKLVEEHEARLLAKEGKLMEITNRKLKKTLKRKIKRQQRQKRKSDGV